MCDKTTRLAVISLATVAVVCSVGVICISVWGGSDQPVLSHALIGCVCALAGITSASPANPNRPL